MLYSDAIRKKLNDVKTELNNFPCFAFFLINKVISVRGSTFNPITPMNIF